MRIIILKNNKTAVKIKKNPKENYFYWNKGLYNIEPDKVGRRVNTAQWVGLPLIGTISKRRNKATGSQLIYFQGSSIPVSYQAPPKPRGRGRPKAEGKTADEEYLEFYVKLNSVKQQAEVNKWTGFKDAFGWLSIYNIVMLIIAAALIYAYISGQFLGAA